MEQIPNKNTMCRGERCVLTGTPETRGDEMETTDARRSGRQFAVQLLPRSPVRPRWVDRTRVADGDPGRNRHALAHASRAAVPEPDDHRLRVPALGDVPVASLGRWAGLEPTAAVVRLCSASVHLPDAGLLRTERRAGPGVAAVAHRVPGPGRQCAPAGSR